MPHKRAANRLVGDLRRGQKPTRKTVRRVKRGLALHRARARK